MACALLPGAEADDDQAERDQWLRAVAAAVEAEDLSQAQQLLSQWQGSDTSTTWLWRGQVHSLAEDWSAAAEAYRQTLSLDPSLRHAAEGLIQALAQLQDWAGLRRVIGPWLEQPDAPAGWWQAAAFAALEEDDPLMAEALAIRGLARHPDQRELRRIWAQTLQQRSEYARAVVLWRAILASPQDASPQQQAQDWYQLAANQQALEQAAAVRQSLQVAHSLDPQHTAIADGLLGSLVAAEFTPAAFALAQRLIDDGNDNSRQRLLLAAQAAEQAGAAEQGLAWLERIPEGERGRSWLIHQARLAAHDDDHSQARQALARLFAQGHDEPDLRLWAARLAWEDDDLAGAEAHLRAVMAQPGEQQQSARLSLIRLLLNRGRHSAARQQAQTAYDHDPYDPQVRRLWHYAQRLEDTETEEH